MKENQKKKERNFKDSLKQFILKDRTSLIATIMNNAKHSFLIFVCFVISLVTAIAILGDLASSYNDDNYTYLNNILFGYYDKSSVDEEGNPEFVAGAVTEEAGIDILGLQQTVYKVNYSYMQNNHSKLECSLKTGILEFFDPKITVEFSSSMQTLSTVKNFDSIDQYKNYFWTFFAICIIVATLLLWLLLQLFIYHACKVFKFFYTKKQNGKNQSSETDIKAKLTKNNQEVSA